MRAEENIMEKTNNSPCVKSNKLGLLGFLIGLFICVLFTIGCKREKSYYSEEYPFRGIWISETSDEYLKLQIDLYSRSVYFNRKNGDPSYGFLEMVNDYVGDYQIITDVISIEEDKARVAVYSLRYGEPDDTTHITLSFNRNDGGISWGETLFSKEQACRYVEILKPNVDIHTSPTDKASLGVARYGQIGNLLDYDRGFYKVLFDNKQEGYVSDEYANVVCSDTIPEKAIEELYSATEEVGYFAYLSFQKKGDGIFMEVQNISVPMDGTLYDGRYSYSTVFYGTIDGNRIVFTKCKDIFMPNLENITLADLDEIKDGNENVCAYYSFISKGFVFQDGLFLRYGYQ